MDTSTHLLAGLSLAGLSMVDPAIAADDRLLGAVMLGTVLGAQAPDADMVLRFKSNACYIRNHRGITHSWIAVPIWAAGITSLIQWLYGFDLPWLHLGGWILLATVLHVVSDLFNSYGTMAAWPISKRFIAWNIIHLFDPFLFVLRLAAICLWAFGAADPEWLFPFVYAILVLYYISRTLQHRSGVKRARSLDKTAGTTDSSTYTLIPTLTLSDWNVIRRNPGGSFTIGNLHKDRLTWIETLRSADHEAVERSKLDKDIQGFLAISDYRVAELVSYDWGWEVRWVDVRYRHRQEYLFNAIIVMDRDYEKMGSFVGWVSDKKLVQLRTLHTY
jgi:inner membrane protein